MTIEDIIWDLRTLLRQLTDDSSVQDGFLINKINNYRSILMYNYYMEHRVVDPYWWQRLGRLKTTDVLGGDHPDQTVGSIRLSKVTIPSVVTIPGLDVIRIFDLSRSDIMYLISQQMLMEMIRNKDFRLCLFSFYYVLDNSLYIYPNLEEVSVDAILSNPLDGFKFTTEYGNLVDLTHGNLYLVISGSVKEEITQTEQVIYKKGELFTANRNYIYSGNAKVKAVTQYGKLGRLDNYPMDRGMAQEAILLILTKDYQLERTRVFDVFNDAMDQLKVITKNYVRE